VAVGVGRDCGDMHDFGGGGNVFGVGGEEFDDTVDGRLGISLKIHGLQPEVIFVTPSEWKAPARRVVVAAHHPPLCSSLRNVLNKKNSENDMFAKPMTRHTEHPGSRTDLLM